MMLLRCACPGWSHYCVPDPGAGQANTSGGSTICVSGTWIVITAAGWRNVRPLALVQNSTVQRPRTSCQNSSSSSSSNDNGWAAATPLLMPGYKHIYQPGLLGDGPCITYCSKFCYASHVGMW
jgi:hypothetical protein